MKKIIYLLFAISLMVMASSCEDILEAPTKSSLDESVIFSNETLAEGAVAGIIQSFAETNSYRGRYLVFYGINTDTEVRNGLRDVNHDWFQAGQLQYRCKQLPDEHRQQCLGHVLPGH
jgi:starch-binding outer membrane protein, SusD/RagB family